MDYTEEKRECRTLNEFQLSTKQERILDGVMEMHRSEKQQIAFSHSTMCQTALPFKELPEGVRKWKSRNGERMILLEAGEIYSSKLNDTVEIGLPYGTKPRLLMHYFNTQAMKTQSPEIEVENSLHAFLKRIGVGTNGRNYATVKEQLARLSASHMTVGETLPDGRSSTEYGRIVEKVDLWFPKDDNQRVLWPNQVKLSDSYFTSLMNHAVPLDEQALHLLKDSALALDIYAMLAERLHRIPQGKTQFIPWVSLYELYGGGYTRITKFREKFREALMQVHSVYMHANFEETFNNKKQPKGLELSNSKPPVTKLIIQK